MNCCACKKRLPGLDPGYILVEGLAEYVLCENCAEHFSIMKAATTDEVVSTEKAHFIELLRDPDTPEAVKDVFRSIEDALWDRQESQRNYEAAREEAIAGIMLTTGPNFEGYRVVHYLGIIASEVVFKNGFWDRVDAGIESIALAASFKAVEYSATSKLIETARAYVIEQFRVKAVDIGANAVLGVDLETSFGTDVVRVSVNGTAVLIEKIDEE